MVRKFLNEPTAFAKECLDGLIRANGDLLVAVGDSGRVVARRDAPATDRVAIVTGGGSGHFPLFAGYVGPGLVTAAAVGDIFSSPSPAHVVEATHAVSSGGGILFLYGNYTGDVLSFGSASDRLEREGIRVATVLGADDVGSAPRDGRANRRGTAGLVFQYKCAGAAAEQGASLDEVADVATRVAANVGTIGVGLGPTMLPTTGRPSFALAEGFMEFGVGIHGEPAQKRLPLEQAHAVARRMVEAVVADIRLARGERVAMLVNGLGATPAEELYLLWRGAVRVLQERGVSVERSLVGEYVTSLDMAGASVSLLRVDDEILGLLDAPGRAAGFRA